MTTKLLCIRTMGNKNIANINNNTHQILFYNHAFPLGLNLLDLPQPIKQSYCDRTGISHYLVCKSSADYLHALSACVACSISITVISCPTQK